MQKNKVGLWIDHRKAVIVTLSGPNEVITQIPSDMSKHVRYSGGGADSGAGEDGVDRHFDNQLAGFYDEVIAYLREAEAILIFGPGEAKGELAARTEHEGIKHHIVELDTADKLTDHQIAAKVREHFKK